MPPDSLTPSQFVENWRNRDLTERESAQTHFIQLCRLLGVAAPYDQRTDDADYRFDAITEAAGSIDYTKAKRHTAAKGKAKSDSNTGPLFGAPSSADPADPATTRSWSAMPRWTTRWPRIWPRPPH